MSAPVIPSSFQIYKYVQLPATNTLKCMSHYSSYVEDPIWQGKFTIIWCSGLAVAIAISLPNSILSLRRGRFFKSITGISEAEGYRSVYSDDDKPLSPPESQRSRRLLGVWKSLVSQSYWSLPKLELNLGQGAHRSVVIPYQTNSHMASSSHSLVGLPRSCAGLYHKGFPSHFKPK